MGGQSLAIKSTFVSARETAGRAAAVAQVVSIHAELRWIEDSLPPFDSFMSTGHI
jgi:hypothetical protein